MPLKVLTMFGYAEIHYRPRFLVSFLKMSQPEIVFDAPHRVNPGLPIPVGLVIKDAHRYPVTLDAVIIHMLYQEGIERVARFSYWNQLVDSPLWWDVFNVIPERNGHVQITPYLEFHLGKKAMTISVDNYKGLTRRPLQVYASPESLPVRPGWFHGDIHCHTEYTEDQIEFGAPLGMTAHAASCLGLDWIATADHSYDLDDRPGSWVERDPSLTKWKSLRESVAGDDHAITVLPGEEVSCRGENGGNRHLLCIGNEAFIPGAGDSGEAPLDNRSEHTIQEVVQACIASGGIACASHPLEREGFMERLLLKRGEWSGEDIRAEGLCALQFYNGICDSGFSEGKKKWVELLLEGRRIYAFGGNDSHGDMNRRRSIAIPLCSLREDMAHLLGMVRTVVRAETAASEHIMDGLRQGKAVVTDGPFLDMRVKCGEQVVHCGGTAPSGCQEVLAECFSSREYGSIHSLQVFIGRKGDTDETLHVADITPGMTCTYKMTINLAGVSYIRAECTTEKGHFALTNPVWIEFD